MRVRAGVIVLLIAPAIGSPARAVAPCAGTYTTQAALAGPSGGAAAAAAAADPAPGARAEAKPVARLELKPQARFSYTVTRGEREETAEGRWRATDDRVILTGDPVNAPAFILAAEELLREPALRIELDLPNGLSRQYFTVAVRLADGSVVGRAFTEAAFEMATTASNPPVALRIDVPRLALSSPEFILHGDGPPGAGHALQVRFAANDLGKVAFGDTPLVERDGALILPQPTGDLALRREGRCTAD